ncbi:MAG: hypothetical protein C0606_17640 [Hyphomicrobiales bacterium]|nr:MAG: hypothetical protein C0606_17640 [Hyphomicrobiales bacterium]
MPAIIIAGMIVVARLFLIPCALLALSLPAAAKELLEVPASREMEKAGPASEAESHLDTLFAALAEARTADEAESVAGRINRELVTSNSPTVSLLMERALLAVSAEDYPLALDLLDSVVLLAPDFVEGWNKRATVYYLLDELNLSLNDIEQTLRLEPRHYGALIGFGLIMEKFEEKPAALKAYRKVLSIYPHNETATKHERDLSKDVEGVPL